jgi:hypothetical protein
MAMLAERDPNLINFNTLGSDAKDRGEFFRRLSGLNVGEIPSIKEPDEYEMFRMEQDRERLNELESWADIRGASWADLRGASFTWESDLSTSSSRFHM